MGCCGGNTQPMPNQNLATVPTGGSNPNAWVVINSDNTKTYFATESAARQGNAAQGNIGIVRPNR